MRYPLRSLTVSRRSRAFTSLAVPTLVALSALAAGCSGGGSGDDDDSSGTTANSIAIKDENNFTTLTSKLNLPTVDTAPASNLDIDWASVTKDLQCHAVNPATDIDAVLFLRFKDSMQANVAATLDNGDLSSNDLVAPAPFKIEPADNVTTAKLKDFTNNGTALDPAANYPEDDHVYLLVFQHGTSLGQGARSMVFIKPTADSSNTKVSAPNNTDCVPGAGGGLLSFGADLHSLTPVAVPLTGTPTLDWSKMTKNSQGQPLALAQIDRMLVGFYKGHDAAYLEQHFLDLEMIPDASWELKLDKGTTHGNLKFATNRDGSGMAFPGFQAGGGTDGTWIAGLFCDSCQSPAPFVVTILKPQ
jgi:hypothetical protein